MSIRGDYLDDLGRMGAHIDERQGIGRGSAQGSHTGRPGLAGEDRDRPQGERAGTRTQGGQAGQFPVSGGPDQIAATPRTPLFAAQHADRYERQGLITRYEALTSANLIVVIDSIFPQNMTLLEELLFDVEATKPLHVLLASPGGDGETAIRMVRSIQARCPELTVVIPDMAKSAATLLCLGADHILMGRRATSGRSIHSSLSTTAAWSAPRR
ncbi:hypothetical protein WEI85_07150 [Actinomycetes bacterium KLBMP 9797]